jgi:hypothetical protein
MSLVTTELAPMTDRRPIRTPLVTTTLAPSHTLSSNTVGPFAARSLLGNRHDGIAEPVIPIGDVAAGRRCVSIWKAFPWIRRPLVAKAVAARLAS